MTLKEKLAELRPDYTATERCPDHFEFLNIHEPTSEFCQKTPCEECWSREFEPPKKSAEAEHWKDTALIAKYSDENKKLKEFLRQAMNDINGNGCGNHCSACMYGGNFDIPFCNRDWFKWKHATEAEKILKGE